MKKYLIILLNLIIVLTAVACKNNKTTTETNTQSTSADINMTDDDKKGDDVMNGIDYESNVGYLVNDSKTYYSIVIPENAKPGEKTAANELQSYIEKSTDVKIGIITDAQFTGNEREKYISIGDTKLRAEGY